MTAAVFAKHHGALRPADDDAAALVSQIKDGREVMVEVTLARNPRAHRLFFKMLAVLVENSDAFVSVEHALVALKYATGEVDTIVDGSTGEVHYAPRSIRFSAMDQTAFSDLFDRSIKVITHKWLVGTDADELRQRIFDLVDRPGSIGRRVA